jgi:hypothetical protein
VDTKSQRGRILAKLIAARGWVSALELSSISLQYSARLFEIRHKLGIAIESRITIVDGVKHGEFRWAGTGVTAEAGRLARAREWIAMARTEPTEPTLFDMERQHRDEN